MEEKINKLTEELENLTNKERRKSMTSQNFAKEKEK